MPSSLLASSAPPGSSPSPERSATEGPAPSAVGGAFARAAYQLQRRDGRRVTASARRRGEWFTRAARGREAASTFSMSRGGTRCGGRRAFSRGWGTGRRIYRFALEPSRGTTGPKTRPMWSPPTAHHLARRLTPPTLQPCGGLAELARRLRVSPFRGRPDGNGRLPSGRPLHAATGAGSSGPSRQCEPATLADVPGSGPTGGDATRPDEAGGRVELAKSATAASPPNRPGHAALTDSTSSSTAAEIPGAAASRLTQLADASRLRT